ncbi:MAG: hypothetical protein ACI9OJ_001908, partial [Myxococcota bacterium]
MLESVLEKIAGHLGVSKPASLLPEDVVFSAEAGDDGIRIQVEIEAEMLGEDFANDGPSAPTRAMCMAAWLTQLGEPARAEITVLNATYSITPEQRRSAFILAEYAELLPHLVTVSGGQEWKWPSDPVFNVESRRSAKAKTRGQEGRLGTALAADRDLRATLAELDGEVEPLRGGLPVGLFDEAVMPGNRWMPAGSSAVDLWTRTLDRKTVHLFELKAGRKTPFGILAEAFYYSRMLSYVRDRRSIEFAPNADGMNAIRSCESIRMWLTAPKLDPLIWHPKLGSAPLDAL